MSNRLREMHDWLLWESEMGPMRRTGWIRFLECQHGRTFSGWKVESIPSPGETFYCPACDKGRTVEKTQSRGA